MRKYPAKSGPFEEALYFEQEEIEAVCETSLKSVGLYPDNPSPIRIERFLEKKFGLSPEYEDLPDGILGYTKFGPSGPEKVVLAAFLSSTEDKISERRIATTIAHEAGHILFHSDLFQSHFNKTSADRFHSDLETQDDGTRTLLCRDLPCTSGKPANYSGRWWEHQANKAIGALLMPLGLLKISVAPFFELPKNEMTYSQIPHLEPKKREEAILCLSEFFDVNPVAAKIRLEEIYPVSKFRNYILKERI